MAFSGLGHLLSLDQLLVKQIVTVFDANQYEIKNSAGEILYRASEEYDCCDQCYGSQRKFNITLTDSQGNQVIQLYRDTVCCEGCCFPSSQSELQVYAPPGNLVGTVESKFALLTPQFDVKNANGAVVLKIEGPIIRGGFSNIDFKVLSLDKSTVVGKVSKQWSGLFREAFTMADHFGVSFPPDLDVQMKAVLLGACFLIVVMGRVGRGSLSDEGAKPRSKIWWNDITKEQNLGRSLME